MNQGYSLQNEDGTWSDASRSNLPPSPPHSPFSSLPNSISPSPPNSILPSPATTATTANRKISPPRRTTRSSTQKSRNVTQQPTVDQFFTRTEKPTIPTKRKAEVSSVEEFLPGIAEESSEPPRKKTTTVSTRMPRQLAVPKTRKPVAKAKQQLPSEQNATLDKPEAWGEPEVWAEKRQQLCAALPYYDAYESAAYKTKGMVAGFLVNQGAGPRDVFTQDIYITGV